MYLHADLFSAVDSSFESSTSASHSGTVTASATRELLFVVNVSVRHLANVFVSQRVMLNGARVKYFFSGISLDMFLLLLLHLRHDISIPVKGF